MSKGFQRLRNTAACGIMGLGLLGAGSGRATMVSTGYKTGASYTLTNGDGFWGKMLNYGLMFNSHTQTTSAGFSVQFPPELVPTKAADLTNPEWIKGFVLLDGSVANGTTTLTDAFGSAFHLAVDGNLFMNPGGEVDLSDNILSTGVHRNITPGIDAHIQFFFHDGVNAPTVLRAMYTLTNTTGADIQTSALVAGTLGSDQYTTVKDSYNVTDGNDLTISDADMWFITDDNSNVGDGNNTREGLNTPLSAYWDPKILLVRYGEDAAVTPVNTLIPGQAHNPMYPDDKGNFGFRYDVTVPANDSIRLLVFAGLYTSVGDAQLQAPQLENLAGLGGGIQLLQGLSDQDLRKTVNYGIASDLDLDGDTVTGSGDNCLRVSNLDQSDSDSDGVGDVCDAFPDNAAESLDSDGDGVGDNSDALPFNPRETVDSDGDGIGDIADNCPAIANSSQADSDGDGTGDACASAGGGDSGGGGGGALTLPTLLGGLALWFGGRRRRRT